MKPLNVVLSLVTVFVPLTTSVASTALIALPPSMLYLRFSIVSVFVSASHEALPAVLLAFIS